MPDIFDIAGSIILESNAFQGSVRAAESRLKGLDSALDSTIAKSNKLGDTSATVARRYEKLAEGIKAQRDRLLDNALAFEKGEISGKQFSNVVVSVDKATTTLNSKLKDAKARLTELNETGMTHFQQQVTQAVDVANNKLESFRQNILATQRAASGQSAGLFSNLSGFQKTQLSFQANDIISGLLSGQSPLQIAAQQGGQIVQIFQQGKQAQEGVVTATQAAATAQAGLATSAQATATSMAATSASATVLGASVGTLVGLLSVGAIAIFAVYKTAQALEESAKQRLKLEELITGEFNRQNILAAELAKKRAAAAEERAFNQFAGTAPPELIQQQINQLVQLEAAAVAKAAEIRRRQEAVAAVPGAGPNKLAETLVNQLKGEAAAAEAEARSFQEKILKLDEGLAASKQRRADDDVKFTREAERAKFEAISEASKAALDAQEKATKKLIDDAKKKAKEFADQVKQAKAEIYNVFGATTDNPFTKIFLSGEQAVLRMLEATKGLGKELQGNLRKLIESDTATKAYRQSLDNALNASNLRAEAAKFASAGGFQRFAPIDGVEESVARRARMQLFANYSSAAARAAHFKQLTEQIVARDFQENIARQFGAIGATGNVARLNESQLAELDKKIIAITQGVDPSKLNQQQRQVAADARLREAGREEKESKEDREIRKDLRDYLKKLLEGKALEIEISDPQGLTAGAKTATPGTVNARYKQ